MSRLLVPVLLVALVVGMLIHHDAIRLTLVIVELAVTLLGLIAEQRLPDTS